MHALKRHATLIIAVLCLAATAPMHAEPIALRGDDAELRKHPELDKSDKLDEAISAAPASAPPTGEAKDAASAPGATALAERRSTASDEAAKSPADATTPAPPAGRVPAPRPPPVDGADAAAAGELADAALSPFLQTESRVEESEWEREIKEAIRPVYDELAASGVVDAVQGIKSYINLLNAVVAHEGGRLSGVAGPAPAADPLVAEPGAQWSGSATGDGDRYASGGSAVHGERERMIAALILEDWITTLKPWFFGLIASYLVWQIARVAIDYSHWKSVRSNKRGARGGRHRRSTSSRRPAR